MKDLYLNTLRDCLTGKAYNALDMHHSGVVRRVINALGYRIGKPSKAPGEGFGWPLEATTMVGTKRLDNFRACIESVNNAYLRGAIVECGVWRGGAAIFAAGVCKAGNFPRNIFVCDSFSGLPRPSLTQDKGDRHWLCDDALAVNLEEVQDNFKRFHLDSDNIHFVKGWFKDTLHKLPTQQIAVLRADGDMYESTRDILQIAHRVVPGGFIIIDDYFVVPGCKKATDEYLSSLPTSKEIHNIDGMGIYWQV